MSPVIDGAIISDVVQVRLNIESKALSAKTTYTKQVANHFMTYLK
jgi:hypothetical protein